MLVLTTNLLDHGCRTPGFYKIRCGIKTHDTFKLDAIIPELKSKNKVGILYELAEMLSQVSGVSQDLLVQSLWERERMGSTGIGGGLAIPNCRLDGIERCYLAFGRSLEGMDFKSIDRQPVRLFFSFCSPIHHPEMHIRLLADLSCFLKNGILRHQLINAWDKQDIPNFAWKQQNTPLEL